MLERIHQAVAAHRRLQIPVADDLVPAAVLIPLFERDARVHLLMQKRTENLDHHKGQIAYPGGGCEPRDPDAVATALREAHEEVGLRPGDVEVFGPIDDIITVTRFRVTPVVGRIPHPYPFRPSPLEVETLLEVPLDLFGDPPAERTEMLHDGQTFVVEAYRFDGHFIWGATARITRSLVALLEET